jgi:DNA polymerase III alpha subunit
VSQFRAPSTASGVTFVTLEGETGTINVVVWRATAERYRRALLGSALLTVYGHAERVETSAAPAMHLIASRPADKRRLLCDLTVERRDSQRCRSNRHIAVPKRATRWRSIADPLYFAGRLRSSTAASRMPFLPCRPASPRASFNRPERLEA